MTQPGCAWIELLKRVPQVRILPGAQGEGSAQEGVPLGPALRGVRGCGRLARPCASERFLREEQTMPYKARHTRSMAIRKITITVPEELVESIKERVDARGVSGYIAAAAAHQDAMDRLRELAERLEEEHGAVTDDEQQAALDRIAAIDGWHDERPSHSNEAA